MVEAQQSKFKNKLMITCSSICLLRAQFNFYFIHFNIILPVYRTFQQTYTYLEKTATTKIIEDLAALAAELAM